MEVVKVWDGSERVSHGGGNVCQVDREMVRKSDKVTTYKKGEVLGYGVAN